MNWTESDKAWLAELLQGVEKRLLVAVDAKLQVVETRFSQGLQDIEAKFSQQLQDVETKLLTEFHKWASPSEARQRTHTAALRAIDEEMEYLSDRVKKLESQA